MVTFLAYIVCTIAYAVLAALILLQTRRSRTGTLLAGAAAATSVWALTCAVLGHPLQGWPGLLDLLRAAVWYGFVLHLYRRALPRAAHGRVFITMGLVGALALAASVMVGLFGPLGGHVAILLPTLAPSGPDFGMGALPEAMPGAAPWTGAVPMGGILLRLAVAICQLLLLENLYRGTTSELRWHVGLACIALGGLAAYDIVLCADVVLFHSISSALVGGRALATAMVAPLLAVAAARNRNWQVNIHVSRAAAFHTATLVVSGVFLLALALAGELLRSFASRLGEAGADWAGLAEISLMFAGLVTLAVLLTSGSARSALRGLLVDHFFTLRYDYRREWLRCIETLSPSLDTAARSGGGPDGGPGGNPGGGHAAVLPLPTRVIRAVADVVDSPAGLLFMRDPDEVGLTWEGAWNMPPSGRLPPGHPLLAALEQAGTALVVEPAMLAAPPTEGLHAWLAVRLPVVTEPVGGDAPGADPDATEPVGAKAGPGRFSGCVLLAPPRAPFRLDSEVFSLLRVLAREVATHLAERRAARVLVETRDLRAYGERFAFVAHDIKNVSSQLSLLLSNAETHLANPEFQQDMLTTVRASVARIGGLIRKLEPQPDRVSGQGAEPGAHQGTATPAALPGMPQADPPGLQGSGSQGHDEAVLVAPRLKTACNRPTAGTRVRLTLDDLEAAQARAAMNPAALDAAVAHLLDNAIAAAGPSGQVTIRLHGTGRPPSIGQPRSIGHLGSTGHLRSTGPEPASPASDREPGPGPGSGLKSDWITIDIIDDGPGMSPEFIRDELFRPFRTHKPGGSGIGAFQARELLRRAGGELAVLSRVAGPERGTTMRLLLPRAVPAGSAPGLASAASPAVPQSSFETEKDSSYVLPSRETVAPP